MLPIISSPRIYKTRRHLKLVHMNAEYKKIKPVVKCKRSKIQGVIKLTWIERIWKRMTCNFRRSLNGHISTQRDHCWGWRDTWMKNPNVFIKLHFTRMTKRSPRVFPHDATLMFEIIWKKYFRNAFTRVGGKQVCTYLHHTKDCAMWKSCMLAPWFRKVQLRWASSQSTCTRDTRKRIFSLHEISTCINRYGKT